MFIRNFITFLLFGVFVNFFGYESFKKFKSGGIVIDRKQKHSESIESPAIVVCPRNPKTGKGWKENKSNEILYYLNFGPCKDETTGENISNCFDNHTYSLGEVVTQNKIKEK